MFIQSWKTDFESTWKQWTNRSGMIHSQFESCYGMWSRQSHRDVWDDIVILSRWTRPHSRWQSCSNVPRARFRYSLSQNPLKASYFSVALLGLNSDRNESVCLCGCQCQWPSHWDTLPSQICLKHCHNKPLNQSLVCTPSKASLFLLFLQMPTGTFYHTILLSASSTWHSSHCAPAASFMHLWS